MWWCSSVLVAVQWAEIGLLEHTSLGQLNNILTPPPPISLKDRKLDSVLHASVVPIIRWLG